MPSAAMRAQAADLLNQIRNAVPDGAAEYIGTLKDNEPSLAVLEAYLYLKRKGIDLPSDIAHSLRNYLVDVGNQII